MYRTGDRNQTTLMPPSVEDYVSQDNPVRAYDAFIEAMDLKDLGIKLEDDKVGNPCYHPKAMLKLFVYGTSYGVRSSRKLEREAVNNLSFIWLLGGLMPDHKTIAEFRRNNKDSLKNILKQCALLCIDMDLIEGNMLFVDGTKINANSGVKSNWTKKRCDKSLKHIDERITKILAECEQTDAEEENQASHVHMKEELTDAKAFKEKVEQILEKMKKVDLNNIEVIIPEKEKRDSQKTLTYDPENDCFTCEAGKKLVPKGLTPDSKSRVYHIEKASDCQACKICTKSKTGRSTSRLLKEDLRQKLHAQYRSKEGKEIYALRRQKAEHPFGHIKRNLKFEAFLLRGIDGVKAEFSIASCCFNIARAITILGVSGLITKLRAI